LYWSYILACLGCFALWLMAKKNKWGWIIGASIQILWIIFALVTKQYGFIVSAIVYAGFYINGYIKWSYTTEKVTHVDQTVISEDNNDGTSGVS